MNKKIISVLCVLILLAPGIIGQSQPVPAATINPIDTLNLQLWLTKQMKDLKGNWKTGVSFTPKQDSTTDGTINFGEGKVGTKTGNVIKYTKGTETGEINIDTRAEKVKTDDLKNPYFINFYDEKGEFVKITGGLNLETTDLSKFKTTPNNIIYDDKTYTYQKKQDGNYLLTEQRKEFDAIPPWLQTQMQNDGVWKSEVSYDPKTGIYNLGDGKTGKLEGNIITYTKGNGNGEINLNTKTEKFTSNNVVTISQFSDTGQPTTITGATSLNDIDISQILEIKDNDISLKNQNIISVDISANTITEKTKDSKTLSSTTTTDSGVKIQTTYKQKDNIDVPDKVKIGNKEYDHEHYQMIKKVLDENKLGLLTEGQLKIIMDKIPKDAIDVNVDSQTNKITFKVDGKDQDIIINKDDQTGAITYMDGKNTVTELTKATEVSISNGNIILLPEGSKIIFYPDEGTKVVDKKGRPTGYYNAEKIYVPVDQKINCGADKFCDDIKDDQFNVDNGIMGGDVSRQIFFASKFFDNYVMKFYQNAMAGQLLWDTFMSDSLGESWDNSDLGQSMKKTSEFFEKGIIGGDYQQAQQCKQFLTPNEQVSSYGGGLQTGFIMGNMRLIDNKGEEVISAYISGERSPQITHVNETDPLKSVNEYFYKLTFKVAAINKHMKFNVVLKGNQGTNTIFKEELQLNKGQTITRRGNTALVDFSSKKWESACLIFSDKGDIDTNEICTPFVETNSGYESYDFSLSQPGTKDDGTWTLGTGGEGSETPTKAGQSTDPESNYYPNSQQTQNQDTSNWAG